MMFMHSVADFVRRRRDPPGSSGDGEDYILDDVAAPLVERVNRVLRGEFPECEVY